jgi:hypothetical protein
MDLYHFPKKRRLSYIILQFLDGIVTQRQLPRLLFDYFLLLLDFGVGSRGRRSFKFENMWLQAKGFVDQAKTWLRSYIYEGTLSHVLAQKLKALKADLKKWNGVFGNVWKQKEMEKGFCELDMIVEVRSLTEDENLKREEYSSNLERSIYLEQVSWRQKSRALWLREGHKNTKIFHKMANSFPFFFFFFDK